MKNYKTWLMSIGETYNVDVLNLFEWELDDGNWLAMCQMEFDIAWKDIFTPFNCRDLITCLLSVDEQYMKYPEYELHRKLILSLWPEVLSVPINPHKQKKEESLLTIVVPLIRSRLSQHMPELLKKGLKAMLGR